jgi:hypothetical protein
MLIKRHLFKDPNTEKVEVVFEYPPDLASPTLRGYFDCTLVTQELMRIPILVVPNEYLTFANEYEMDDCMYADFQYLEHKRKVSEDKADNDEYNRRMKQVRELFGIGTTHKRSCKTIFFTGPKPIFKKTFTDDWVYREVPNTLCLEHQGHFQTIDSLSLKGLNDVFLTGAFNYAGIVMENTQCKITISNAQCRFAS